MHACRDTFLLQMALSGYRVTKRDLAHNINFFMNVPVTWWSSVCGRRLDPAIREMRAAMDVLCLISNCPQQQSLQRL
jgi:uncharacterized protein YcgI (DUF1989 family)